MPREHVEPALLFPFDKSPTSMVELESDVFYLFTTDGYATHASDLYRVDLREWKLGQGIHPELILAFPSQVRALNGSCLIVPRTILVADSFASLIWRVELSEDGRSASASIWRKHYSMLYHPGELKPEQPGVNGLRFSKKTSYVYYTSTVLKLAWFTRGLFLWGGAIKKNTTGCKTAFFTHCFHLRHTGSMYSAECCSSTILNADSHWWPPVCCRCLRLAFATRGLSPSISSLTHVDSNNESRPQAKTN
jgi:hypothetical protein